MVPDTHTSKGYIGNSKGEGGGAPFKTQFEKVQTKGPLWGGGIDIV